ncbi:ABC transporter substrate-binding protein [Histidinibacterium aquaticum]|uniref:ABC transporter substrate-binding protein n=1 Tax=Histidinibacterium aquaticum TaxID=2613962 RepID=A0A5J5GL10_9RHOB|nr:ABC transporter substrate-binding protein [Histidinibacterium aquaticum]KAA9008234.1 ABC transporter substrate-binding protein [Histidinibacterium aquaticum]
MKTFRNMTVVLAMSLPAAGWAQELTTINVINPLPRSTIFYPLIAGEALGYFEEEGVEVNLLPSETSIPYVAFVQNGQADLAILDASETLSAVGAGTGIQVIYEANQRAPEGIAVSADSDVQSIEELAGTTVGLVTDRDRAFLAQALYAVDMSLDDVETVVVGEGGPTLAAAFRDQTVSAISGASSDWLALQANGIDVRMITPEEVMLNPAGSFVISEERMDELRGPVEGFLRAWSKGAYVGELDEEALAEISRQAVPAEWENEEFGQNFLAAAIDVTLPQTEQFGGLQPDVWESLQERLVAIGAMDEVVPVDTFLDDSFVGPANDWSKDEVADELQAWADENM